MEAVDGVKDNFGKGYGNPIQIPHSNLELNCKGFYVAQTPGIS